MMALWGGRMGESEKGIGSIPWDLAALHALLLPSYKLDLLSKGMLAICPPNLFVFWMFPVECVYPLVTMWVTGPTLCPIHKEYECYSSIAGAVTGFRSGCSSSYVCL